MPKLLDLYCGEGGCAVGYSRAGFGDITGVDISPRCAACYPFRFIQGDAIEYLSQHWQEYDAFHCSPVCKGYSVMNNLPWLKGREYPLHILPLRIMLTEIHRLSGKPWVIENVMGARWGAKGLAKRGIQAHGMQAGWLCGTMFGLPFYRHRLFETSFFWPQPAHPKHQQRIRAGHSLAGRARDVVFMPTGKNWTPGQRAQMAKEENDSSMTHRQQSVEFGKPRILETMPSRSINYRADNVGMGHAKGARLAAQAMGVEWMSSEGVSQAIPPAYTEWVGQWMLKAMKEET